MNVAIVVQAVKSDNKRNVIRMHIFTVENEMGNVINIFGEINEAEDYIDGNDDLVLIDIVGEMTV